MKYFKIQGKFFGEDSSLQLQSASTEIRLNLIKSQQENYFYSTVSHLESIYYIGIDNKPIPLKSLYVLSGAQRITSIVAN